jgi:hypothetical protein
MGFVAVDAETAKSAFLHKYGYMPAKVVKAGCLTLAGPIRNQDLSEKGREGCSATSEPAAL